MIFSVWEVVNDPCLSLVCRHCLSQLHCVRSGQVRSGQVRVFNVQIQSGARMSRAQVPFLCPGQEKKGGLSRGGGTPALAGTRE